MQPKNFESRIQDLVYNVDVGIGVHLVKSGLFILAVLALMSLYTASEFWGLKDAEAMDQAQVARQLMDTGSFNTKVIRPAAVSMLTSNGVNPRSIMLEQPDIVHPPVYPFILSIAFRAVSDAFAPGSTFRTFPPEQWAMVPIGHVSTILTGLLLFLIARRFFEQRIAVTSLALFFMSDRVWSTSISGLNLSLAGLFVTATILLGLITATRYNENAAPRHWLLPFLFTSLFATLALLTRYAAGLVIPAIAVTMALMIPRNGWKIGLYTLILSCLLASPWFIRNYQVCGNLFGMTPFLALNGYTPGTLYAFESSVNPSFEGWNNFIQLKWMANTREFYDRIFAFAGNGILPGLFIATYFFKFARTHIHALRIGLLAAMLGLFIVGGFFGENTYRAYFVFWPIIILYGTTFFYLLLDRLQLKIQAYRTAMVSVLMALTVLPLIFTLLPPRVGYPYPPYYPSYTTLVTGMLNNDELLCTDMPWATAWYGGTSSLLLPQTIEEFYEINDLQKRISGIYFTTITRDLPYATALAKGPYSSWFPIFNERIPVNFPLTEAFFLSGRDQLFLTDRARWDR